MLILIDSPHLIVHYIRRSNRNATLTKEGRQKGKLEKKPSWLNWIFQWNWGLPSFRTSLFQAQLNENSVFSIFNRYSYLNEGCLLCFTIRDCTLQRFLLLPAERPVDQIGFRERISPGIILSFGSRESLSSPPEGIDLSLQLLFASCGVARYCGREPRELAAFIIIITLAGPLIPTTQRLEAPGITSKYTIHFYTNHDFYLLPKNLECLVGDSCSGTTRLGTIADRNDLTRAASEKR